MMSFNTSLTEPFWNTTCAADITAAEKFTQEMQDNWLHLCVVIHNTFFMYKLSLLLLVLEFWLQYKEKEFCSFLLV
jgi:hypothetical protein